MNKDEYVKHSERLKEKVREVCSHEGLGIDFYDPPYKHGVLIDDRFNVGLSSNDENSESLEVGVFVYDKETGERVFAGNTWEADAWKDEYLNNDVQQAVAVIKNYR